MSTPGCSKIVATFGAAAGSWGARAYLGLPGLDEGAPADLVVYETDPRVDLSAMMSPRRIVLRGVVVA